MSPCDEELIEYTQSQQVENISTLKLSTVAGRIKDRKCGHDGKSFYSRYAYNHWSERKVLQIVLFPR